MFQVQTTNQLVTMGLFPSGIPDMCASGGPEMDRPLHAAHPRTWKIIHFLRWKGLIFQILRIYIYIYIYLYIYICIYMCDHTYIYICMIPSSDREVPPNGMGPQVAPPCPSTCKLLAAFLRSSLVFARFLQRFWLQASHLLGTCYLFRRLT